jgi:hypothetical protein
MDVRKVKRPVMDNFLSVISAEGIGLHEKNAEEFGTVHQDAEVLSPHRITFKTEKETAQQPYTRSQEPLELRMP